MQIKASRLVYFSPTGTTKSVIDAIAQAIPVPVVQRLDLTTPVGLEAGMEVLKNEIVLIGAPVYAGRIPALARERMYSLKAQQQPAVIVVVYGNRHFDDALLELRRFADKAGFRVIAGAAFIGEHTLNFAVEKDHPGVARGRPDMKDLRNAHQFGSLVWSKVTSAGSVDELSGLVVPGNYPFREWKPTGNPSPRTLSSSCTKCRICESVCPAGAIQVGDHVITNSEKCITCLACVKYCPEGARLADQTWMRGAGEYLYSVLRGERKEPEMFC